MMLLVRHLLIGACLLVSLCPSRSAAVLDAATIDLSILSMKLCLAIQDFAAEDFPGTTLYVDGPNAALFFKNENYCFAAFDTTTRTDMRDWWNNIDPTIDDVCSIEGEEEECCRARNGWEGAYTSPGYRTALDQEILDCKSEGKEVVLTGHSAGGAVAAIAAVALQQTDPIIITFGQPASIVGDCSYINADKYYRFVNTDVNHWGRNLDYDPVPRLNANADQLGNVFLLGDDRRNVVHYGDGNSPSMTKWGFDIGCHECPRYLARLESYQGRANLGTEGWAAGFRCNLDEECSSGTCGGWSWYWSSGKCR